jgi:hypothetical protein
MLLSLKSKNISEQIDNFKNFIVKYKVPIICSFIFTLICFGFMLTNHSLTIDEETWINSNDVSNASLWLMQGRFGIYLIDKFLVPTGTYIPFLWDFLSVLIWNFSGVCFLFCISMFYPKFNKFSSFVFCAYFSSLPLVVGEIISYSMFNLQQSLGMLFMAISVFFIYTYFNDNNTRYIIISSILLFASISIYQAFTVVYIVMIVAYVLFLALEHNYEDTKQIIMNIKKAIFALIPGVLTYYLVNKIITTFIAPDPNNYLGGYIGWNKRKSNIRVILTTFHYIEKILFGDSAVYGGKVILAVTCLFLIYVIVSFTNTKKSIIFVLSILLIIAPFSMAIALGTSGITGRTYTALPLAGAIELLLVNNWINKNRIFKLVVTISTVYILIFNSMYMNRLFYDSFTVYQFDTNVGNEIIHDIGRDGYNYKDKHVVFIGMHDIDRKIISSTSGSTGGSFFSWDNGNNVRMINFLRSQGYDVSIPSASQINYAYNNSKDLKNWPNQNSIKDTNGYIVVKLSDPTPLWFITNGIKRR